MIIILVQLLQTDRPTLVAVSEDKTLSKIGNPFCFSS